jgi:hypothetical protein
MKESSRGVRVLTVIMSFRISNLIVVVAVAGVPTALAVRAAVVRDLKASGVPTSCTVVELTFDSESPVPAKLGVLNVTALPDAETARNWMGDG